MGAVDFRSSRDRSPYRSIEDSRSQSPSSSHYRQGLPEGDPANNGRSSIRAITSAMGQQLRQYDPDMTLHEHCHHTADYMENALPGDTFRWKPPLPEYFGSREGAVEWLKMAARFRGMRIETWQKTKAELESGELTKENSQERNMKAIFSHSYGPSALKSQKSYRFEEKAIRRYYTDYQNSQWCKDSRVSCSIWEQMRVEAEMKERGAPWKERAPYNSWPDTAEKWWLRFLGQKISWKG